MKIHKATREQIMLMLEGGGREEYGGKTRRKEGVGKVGQSLGINFLIVLLLIYLSSLTNILRHFLDSRIKVLLAKIFFN